MRAPLLAGAAAPVDAAARAVSEGAARRAMQMGFSSVAAGLYADLVAQAPTPEEADRLRMDWVMALLEGRQMDAAATALSAVSDANRPRVRLRRALIAMARGDAAGAEGFLNGVQGANLPVAERAWFRYLIGAIADANGKTDAAVRAYQEAISVATSGLEKARFELAQLRASWTVQEPTAAQAENLRRKVEDAAGEQVGYDAGKRYAAVLAALGRVPEAVSFLQNQLLVLPSGEREQVDDFRLLLGVIAGAQGGIGRNALLRLLADGADREKQRIALRMLAQASADDDTLRAELRNELGRLLAATEPHPIEQDLLLYRAQLAPNAEAASRDALALLERFPASDLRPNALGELVSAAWEEGRYRAAAGYAAQARREPLGDREVRAQLGVLQAEAFFRGGDYRSAADAYAAALDEVPAGVKPGDLIFQEVLARIDDDQLTAAANRIDLLAGDPRFDVVNRWQAEWNLARALQTASRVPEAFARVNRLLAENQNHTSPLPTDLAVRIAWLQARLALEAGDPERTLERAPGLRAQLGGVPEPLRTDVASSLRLLEAEANFALNRSDAAIGVLQQLRADYVDSDAAVYSFIVEANYQAGRGQLVEAQRLLTQLVSERPRSRFAPAALFQSALMAEGRREDVYLGEAIAKIEQLVTAYPKDPLVFYARFKQGDILRKLNQWGPARQVYESIINQFPQNQNPDVLAAQMALADCLAAQANSDSSLDESAASIYERLRDLASAPVELRIEAGYKAGAALERRGQIDRAAETWWQVVNEFLLPHAPLPPNVNPGSSGGPGESVAGGTRSDLGTRGRYWLRRLLQDLGLMFEKAGRLDEARRAFELIRDQGLPQAEWAVTQLQRLGGLAPAATAPTPGR